MSVPDNDMRAAGATRSASPGGRDTDDLVNQMDAIRADLQNLTSTVGRITGKRVNRVQDKAMETAYEAEETFRRNPLSAIAIAAGLGFLFGVFARR
jgi:ElaB/YqjD/DUF883 family membrane-anchored ribosome-binding protein